MLDSAAEQRSSATLAPAEHEGLLHATKKKRWKPVWKQRLLIGTLVLSDVVLAVVVWGVGLVGQGIGAWRSQLRRPRLQPPGR